MLFGHRQAVSAAILSLSACKAPSRWRHGRHLPGSRGGCAVAGPDQLTGTDGDPLDTTRGRA